MSPTTELLELAQIALDCETPAELLGALKVWAKRITDEPAPPPPPAAPGPNYRQMWALSVAQVRGYVLSADLARRFEITPATARAELINMCQGGALIATGAKRARRYWLPETFNSTGTSV